MKKLTVEQMSRLMLEDLSREELLTWIRKQVLRPARLSDLLLIRHDTLCAQMAQLGERWSQARTAEDQAFQECKDRSVTARRRLKLERAYIDAKEAADRARNAYYSADRATQRCWEAVEASWAEERK